MDGEEVVVYTSPRGTRGGSGAQQAIHCQQGRNIGGLVPPSSGVIPARILDQHGM